MGFHGKLYYLDQAWQRGVVMEDGEEDDYDDNNIPADWVEGDAFSDDPMGKCGEDFAEDEPVDELG